MSKDLIRACALAMVVLSPAGCSYSEETSWRACCLLSVVTDDPSTPSAQKPIVDWQARTLFSGDGQRPDLRFMTGKFLEKGQPSPRTLERIKATVTEFFVDHPGSQAHDYFLGLGMTCTPKLWAPLIKAMQCEIELPVWIRCHSTERDDVPPPKELREPIAALLGMSVNVSAITVLEFHVRIDPVPGGRLCHR